MFWRLFRTVCIAVFTLSQIAQAAVLLQASVSSENYSVDAVLDFESAVAVDDVKVQFINQTIQIDIPGTSLTDGKLRKTIQSQKVRSLYAYQLNETTMRVRFIYEKPIQANMFEDFVHIASVGNQVKIRVEDPQSRMSASKLKPKTLKLTPPIDLEAELQPKEFAQVKKKSVSAASVLEDEFLTKINEYSDTVSPARVESKVNRLKAVPTTKKPELSEAQIPLNLESKNKKSKVETPWLRLIISFIVISLVGVGTIIFTKKLSKSKARVGGNIRIETVSQQSLGPKKSLAVIRVAGEDILIGITDYNISMIKSLSFIDDEVSEVPQNFVTELDKVTDEFISSRTAKPNVERNDHEGQVSARATSVNPVGEQYSFASIKDIVSDKLKEMRPL